MEEKFCEICGKPLKKENNKQNLCFDCERELKEEDKAWDEFFDNISKKNKGEIQL